MLPLITTQSALFIAESFSLSGPEGIINPFPTHCFWLKQSIEKFFFIVKRSIKKTLDYYLSQKNKEKWFKSFCKILKILLLVFAKLF